MDKARYITLHGAVTGTIWQGIEASQEVNDDLLARSKRLVNATGSGLVDAIKSFMDEGTGDFQSVMLTGDSYVRIVHRRFRPLGSGNGYTERVRYVPLAGLPSILDYVSPDVFDTP